ncbi:MAG: ComEC/Rec2 family competence protein [Kiritimatiellae bacterium]|nr:ComEC/Rec2 family competence protein [Kiritimatiellia bacterium]
MFGFIFSRFSIMWGWAALSSLLLLCAALAWQIPLLRFVIAFLLGVALSWRSEAERCKTEWYAKVLKSDGEAPDYLLKVEGDAEICKGRKRVTASFRSHIGNLPVRAVVPVRGEEFLPKDGEVWKCRGWLSSPKKGASRYSIRNLWVADRCPMEKVSEACGSSPGMKYRRFSKAISFLAKHGLYWSEDLASLGNAMLLNRRESIPYGRLSVFASAGTIHVFAISGLHVMLIAGLLDVFLKGIGLSEKMSAAFSIPLIAGYVMLIGYPPSAVRAGLMTSICQGAKLFNRKSDSLVSWSIAAIVVCALSPQMILNVGCVLSFVVMLGIVLWIRWVRQFASPADVFLFLAAREESFGCEKGRKFYLRVYKFTSWVVKGLGISFVAWIAGAPVAARVFERLSFGSIAINVAIVPLAGIAVALGVFGVVAMLVLPQLGVLFNNLSAFCIFLMTWLSEKVAAIPYSTVETMRWGWWDCGIWYAAWIGLFAILSNNLPKRKYISVKEWGRDGNKEYY